MASIIVLIILFVTPFIIWPFGNSQFELPKIVLFLVLNFLILVSALIKLKSIVLKSLKRELIIIFGGIILLTIYDIIFLKSPIAFFGNNSRFQGIFLLWNLLMFSFISSKIKLPRVSLLVYYSLLTILFLLSLFLGNQIGRAVATIGEPNALASYIIFLWPFAFFSKVSPNRKYVKYAAVILALLTILLTGSKSGMIALGIQVLFLTLFFKLKKFKLAFIVSIILIFISCLLPFLQYVPYENRTDVWRTSLIAGYAHPILGSGFGNTEIYIRQASLELYDRLRGYYVDSAHNIFLDWWIQGGFAGLSLLALLIYGAIKNFYKNRLFFELILFFGIFTTLLFNPANITMLICFWWVVGQGLNV